MAAWRKSSDDSCRCSIPAALVSGESSPGMTPAPVKETKVEAPVEFKSEPANEEADVNVAPVVRKRGRPKK